MKRVSKRIYRLALALLYCFIAFSGNASDSYLIEKQKVVQKSASLGSTTQVVIDNQYGAVNVQTWDKKEVKVVVTIKANGASAEKALEYLEDVEIKESKVDNKIVYKTVIETKNSNWNSLKSLSKSGDNYLRIDYHVMLPSQTTLAIHNKFGATQLPNYEGMLTIESRYGSFKSGTLHHLNNEIKIAYGSGEISYLHGGVLDVRYSNCSVSKMGEVEIINKYGKLSIGEVKDLIASVDYSGVSIGKITNSGTIKVSYSGKFKITESNAEKLDITAAYSTVELPAMPAEYDVSVSFGNFKYPTTKEYSIKQSTTSSGSQTKTFGGYIGSHSTNTNVVKVVAKFGDVKLVE